MTLRLATWNINSVRLRIDQVARFVAERAPELAGNLTVIGEDALKVSGAQVSVAGSPTVLVANLPYNVSVPVLLHLLAELPSIRHRESPDGSTPGSPPP